MSEKAAALVAAFENPDADMLAELTRQLELIDGQIADLQNKRRGIELTRKSLDWTLNGRPDRVTAEEREARRDTIFQYLSDNPGGHSKAAIGSATGIPESGVTLATKHESFECDGRLWSISREYQDRLAAAQGR